MLRNGNHLINNNERNAKAIRDAQGLVYDVLVPESQELGTSGSYPARSLQAMADAGLCGMAIPAEYGGLDLNMATQAHVFTILASGNITAAFILSQHHGSTTLIVPSPNQLMRATWLPGLAAGAHQASQGFNFLNFPAENSPMRAIPVANGYILNGVLPWVSAASTSDVTIAGAYLPDDQQILFAIPIFTLAAQDNPPVIIDPSMELSALSGSQTTKVHFNNLFAHESWIVAGPGEDILKRSLRGTSGFISTCLTVGHAQASLRVIEAALARNSAKVLPMYKWVKREIIELQDAIDTALKEEDFNLAAKLRGQGNALAARAAFFALVASGGSGYLDQQVAQQLYREAAFFSVWSVSGNIIPETISHMLNSL